MQAFWIDKTTSQTLDSIFQYFPAPLQGYLIGFIHQEQSYICNAVRNAANFENPSQLHRNMFLPYPLQIIGHFYSLANSSEKTSFSKKSNLCIVYDKQSKSKQVFLQGKEITLQETDTRSYLMEHASLFRFCRTIFVSQLDTLYQESFWKQLLEQLQLGDAISLPLQPFSSNLNLIDFPKGSIGEFLQQHKLQDATFKPRTLVSPLHYSEVQLQHSSLVEQTNGAIEILFDVFFYCFNKEEWKQVAQQSITLAAQMMQQDVKQAKKTPLKIGTFSFLPLQATQTYPHLVSLVYHFVEPLSSINTREEETDPRLSQLRGEIHDVLFLAKQFPFFRVTNALPISKKQDQEILPVLSNLHWFCGRKSTITMPSKLTLHLVKGHYHFYHYCMDEMKDNGWGCAYRSLQTVISFVKQSYLSSRNVLHIPSHKEMQQTLVYLKDKPNQFIDSKEWIGMVECSLLLDHYCGLASKIINFSSKDHLPTLAKQFCSHFDEHGSPIMIGGGVLALTCLGIDFDASNNEVSFLILDPHYVATGGKVRTDAKSYLQDALHHKAIGWKTANQVFQNNFYNCLLPLIPKTC